MAAYAVEADGQQLALNEQWMAQVPGNGARRALAGRRIDGPLCAGCREREARYGFRDVGADPAADRPRTLCFQCFRVEIGRRQAVAAQLARGWDARQVTLPLLEELSRRRRRAQIAARRFVAAGAGTREDVSA
jgi:hypothetical protein